MADYLPFYTGDANLGLGSTPAIPVTTPDKLDAVNQSARDSMLVNIDQQNKIFQQKVADHNKLLSALSDDQIKVGSTLERDRPTVKKALDDMNNAFYDWQKKGANNLDGALAYQKAKQEANDVATQAQARYVVDTKVKQEAANALPHERNGLLSNHDKYLSGFWNDYNPYVKAVTLDHPGMTTSILRDALVPNAGISNQPGLTHRFTTRTNKDGTTTTWDTVSNKPVTPTQQKAIAAQGQQPGTTQEGGLSLFTTIPGKFYDYGKMLANSSDDFHDEKQRINQTEYADFVLNQADPAQQKAILDHANSRFDIYNKQRGFTDPSQPGYVKPMAIVVDPTGQKHAVDADGRTLSISEFNAKMALSSIAGDYVEKDKLAVDKDAANYLIGKEKADTDAVYKRAMAANAATRAAAYAANIKQQVKLRGTDAEKDKYLDDMYKRNIIQQDSLIEGTGKKNEYSLSSIKQENSLPIFTLEGQNVKQLIPIGGQPVYPNGTSKPDDGKSQKPLYYKGGHYDVNYMINGQPVDVNDLTVVYTKYKNIQGNKWKGSFNDWLRNNIQDGSYIKALIKGANGSTDEQLSRAAQRIISNKDTKKFQEGVFSTEYNDEQIPDNEPQER
jgi:hypothetical protein